MKRSLDCNDVALAIAIYNNSWAPTQSLWSPGQGMALMALEQGVTQGRNSLGNIYVMVAGNDWENQRNINTNLFANSRYAIAVGAVDRNGNKAAYSQEGSPLFIQAAEVDFSTF
ncbi:MAG: S8 family serine peptidase [Desertifilum sp.]|nr:S8 family serine peptidase [Desertifilum sp.]